MTIVDSTLTSIICDDKWSRSTKDRDARRTLTVAGFHFHKVDAIADILFGDADQFYRAYRWELESVGFPDAQARAILDVLTQDSLSVRSQILSGTFDEYEANAVINALYCLGVGPCGGDMPGFEGIRASDYLKKSSWFGKTRAQSLVDAQCLITYGCLTGLGYGTRSISDRTDRIQEARQLLTSTRFKENQAQSLVDVLAADERDSYFRCLKDTGLDDSQARAIVDLVNVVLWETIHR